MEMTAPRLVRPGERKAPPGGQTPGLHREAAFVEEDKWIGFVKADAGTGGWHHHSDNDTYIYLLQGGMRVEPRDRGEAVDGGEGDFIHVPKGIVHREITPEGGATAIVMRVGSGPPVVNVEDGSTEHGDA